MTVNKRYVIVMIYIQSNSHDEQESVFLFEGMKLVTVWVGPLRGGGGLNVCLFFCELLNSVFTILPLSQSRHRDKGYIKSLDLHEVT